MTRYVDLSHVVEHGMVTHPGIPTPSITTFLSYDDSRGRYAPGVEFQIARLEMVANTGTYVDAPAHRFRGAPDLSALPLERLAGAPIVVVPGDPAARAIGPEAFAGIDVRDRAVLVRTGWDRHWGTDAYLSGNPFLTAAAARLLAEAGPAIVGIDSLNVDDIGDPERPAHTAILGAGIPLVEHLCSLDRLEPSGGGSSGSVAGRFFAVPVAVRGMATFPVRAFAILDD